MRDGLRNYMKSPQGHFKPVPGDIADNASEAMDKPRKVKNPNCSECEGLGLRTVLVDSKIHLGKKVQRVTDCYCVKIVYDGKEHKPEQKQLPASAEDEQRESSEAIEKLRGKGLDVDKAAKAMPKLTELSDEELARRRNRMLADLKARGLMPERAESQ